jgi:hypothetical protein
MGNFGTGGWFIIGIILVVLGLLLRSGLIQWLLNAIGMILIVVGIVAVLVGVVSMIAGGRRRSSGF